MNKPDTLLPQTVLQHSNYQILNLVGQGQFGRVFCAVHRVSGQIVALKELEHQQFSTHKLLRELRFLLSLQHPNVVSFQALEHNQTGRYLVMDYCDGGSLRDLMQSEKLSLAQSLNLVSDVLAGLEHIHSQGIVHCDLKPENILLSADCTGWRARISDFGIARLHQELSSNSMDEAGSLAYMAPERFYGKFSPASDLYAVGILLFELATGDRPFSGLPKEVMLAHLNQSVKLPKTMPLLVRSLITTALQKLPSRRFATATEMLKSIRLAAEVESITPSITDTKVTPKDTLASPFVSTQFKTAQTLSDVNVR